MIKENKILGGALVAAMIGAYLSWHHETEAPGTTTVELLDLAPEKVQALRFVGPTSTVAVSFFTAGGERRPWVEVERRGQSRRFVGNQAFDKALSTYAKLEALRSLGSLEGEALAETGVESPERVLEIESGEKTHRFELGGRTSGARDFYARRAGETEVVLLRGTVVTDLEAPEGRFMQRRVREAKLGDVARVEIEAGEKKRTVLHKNRLSPSDAYWASADDPDAVSDALGNYVEKIERLSASAYPPEGGGWEGAAPVLRVTWTDADGETLDTLELRRAGETGGREWLALSGALGRPATVPRATAEQLERDLGVIFE